MTSREIDPLYRAIIGPVMPLFKNKGMKKKYRQAIAPQTKVRGPVSEPYEADPLIVNHPTPTIHF